MSLVAIFFPETATLAVAGVDEPVALKRETSPAFVPDFRVTSGQTMKPCLGGFWRFTARLRLKNDAAPVVTEVQASLLDRNSNRVIEVTNIVSIVLGDRHTLQMDGIVEVDSTIDEYELWWRADGGTPTIDGSQPAYAAIEWEYLG